MEINKNKAVRNLVRGFVGLKDRFTGRPFPEMARVRQISSYHCGPAVLAALYSFLGVRVSQRSIVASLRAQNKIKKYGLSVKDLARAAGFVSKGAFNFWKKTGGRASDLDAAVNKYRSPVGVEWQGVFYEDEDDDNGHYAVITAVDKKTGLLRMADSFPKFAGTDRVFKIKDFMERWWDTNEINLSGTAKKRTLVDHRMMFVITPKGSTWPKKLGMVRG